MSYFTQRIHSFKNAFRGMHLAFKEEAHMKLHLLATIVLIGAGFYFGITRIEWGLIILCTIAVIGMEIINSSIEKLCDHLHPGRHEAVGTVKDLSAGAVLVVSLGAAIVGGIVFWGYVFS
ncbi:MAG: diacylglycerol kinase (ATP) [Flavobacteriales bacterium]|jgi:diacylglycerol kinase (ATP)